MNSESLTFCVNRVEVLRKVQKAEVKGYNYIGARTKNGLNESQTAYADYRRNTAATLTSCLHSLCCYGRTKKISFCPIQLSLPHCESRCFTFSLGTWSTSGAWSCKKLTVIMFYFCTRQFPACTYAL